MRKKWRVIILLVCLVAACAGIFIWQGKSQEKGVKGQLGQFRKERKESKDTKSRKIEDSQESEDTLPKEEEVSGSLDEETGIRKSLLQTDGKTLQSRILVPEGYRRIVSKEGSFGEYLRDYPLKKHGKPVLLYNGEEKGNQEAHAAVFKLPIEKEDLQQCADSVMRMYAEYFWETGQKERIQFHFVDGFLAEYTKWRDGYRIQAGDSSSWVKSANYNDSYSNFKKFMRIVFAYAGTLSMEEEAKKIPLKKLQIGDIFIKGASPGHVVMVVDVCEDKDGKKAFLLAQGYMPAQEFHILINPRHENDPWYYEEEVSYPFFTPEYTFDEGSLQRPGY